MNIVRIAAPWSLPLIANALIAAAVFGQTRSLPSFEATSVKRSAPSSRSAPLSCESGRLAARKDTVVDLIRWAYNLNFDQTRTLEETAPNWAAFGEYYDFEAAALRAISEAECRLMAQAMLADRFGLKFHWETKQDKTLELVLDPKGHKLAKVSAADTSCGVHIFVDGRERPCVPPGESQPRLGYTMSELAALLSRFTMRVPVADRTGSTEIYKIRLSFSVYRRDEPGADPDLYVALQQQLGLRLVERRGPVRKFVIDRIERPDPN